MQFIFHPYFLIKKKNLQHKTFVFEYVYFFFWKTFFFSQSKRLVSKHTSHSSSHNMSAAVEMKTASAIGQGEKWDKMTASIQAVDLPKEVAVCLIEEQFSLAKNMFEHSDTARQVFYTKLGQTPPADPKQPNAAAGASKKRKTSAAATKKKAADAKKQKKMQQAEEDAANLGGVKMAPGIRELKQKPRAAAAAQAKQQQQQQPLVNLQNAKFDMQKMYTTANANKRSELKNDSKKFLATFNQGRLVQLVETIETSQAKHRASVFGLLNTLFLHDQESKRNVSCSKLLKVGRWEDVQMALEPRLSAEANKSLRELIDRFHQIPSRDEEEKSVDDAVASSVDDAVASSSSSVEEKDEEEQNDKENVPPPPAAADVDEQQPQEEDLDEEEEEE